MTAHTLSPRRAMLAQATALAGQLQQELDLSADSAAALSLAVCEDPQTLKLDVLERTLDALKAEVLSLGRTAERHRDSSEYKRPRGYRRPKVPTYLSTLLDAENPVASNSVQTQANLAGALRALDVASALYLLRVGSGSLVSSAAPRPLLLLNGQVPLAWVLLPEMSSEQDAKAQCARLVKHVRKFNADELQVRLYLAELVREGYRVLTTQLSSFDISAA